jgi:hypothetical protein
LYICAAIINNDSSFFVIAMKYVFEDLVFRDYKEGSKKAILFFNNNYGVHIVENDINMFISYVCSVIIGSRDSYNRDANSLICYTSFKDEVTDFMKSVQERDKISKTAFAPNTDNTPQTKQTI